MGICVDIKKDFGEFALDVSFQAKGSRIGILGASGSGKTMILKSIAGILTPDQGKILVEENLFFEKKKKINVSPQKRKIGYLFQHYALFPTMTVEKNIAVGLKGRSKEEIQSKVKEMLQIFRLEGLEKRLPGELSGGQQQRTALARIMAYEPELLLLDEPFSALDYYLKDQLQQELMELLKTYKGTVILVSHDRDEIYRFTKELLVMDKGNSVIFGNTKEIFENPKHLEAARLTGCKNISAIEKCDTYSVYAKDWGITLETEKPIPSNAKWVGIRAHQLVPVFGERQKNCLKLQLLDRAELPFEQNLYLKPEHGATSEKPICWFVQKENAKQIQKEGLPNYLLFPENELLFLE